MTAGTNQELTAEEALKKIDQDAIGAINNHVNDPDLDSTAQFFKLYVPIFKNVISHLSARQLKRLLSALVEVPLADKEYQHKEGFEKQAYHIGDRLIQAKYTMMYFVLSKYEQDQLKQQENDNGEPTKEIQTDSSGADPQG